MNKVTILSASMYDLLCIDNYQQKTSHNANEGFSYTLHTRRKSTRWLWR